MDSYWESQAMAYEDCDQIPQTKLPVTILGKQYSALYDREEIHCDIISRIWCTYRRNFPPIGGISGFTSDSGWGCMHRCGQMMVAQALVMIHLGRDWRWKQNICDPNYEKILKLFYDTKKSIYSIQMISSFGQAEGKSVGKWFGPNTVAQVFKKLAREETWTNLVIHVTMEDGVIIDEIVAECIKKTKQSSRKNSKLPDIKEEQKQFKNTALYQLKSAEIDDNCVEILTPPPTPIHTQQTNPLSNTSYYGNWKPLLLIIPVRLGLNDLNPCYIPAIKEVFQLSQCVGILGGRPSHALWFLGEVGDNLICLDPHQLQMTAQLLQKDEIDSTYHCTRWSLMEITKLDPSLALGFVVQSRDELLDLCEQLQRRILQPAGDHPLFEIHQKRPYYFPPLSSQSNTTTSVRASLGDSEDEFELL